MESSAAHPIRAKTVAVASTAVMANEVSQPIEVSHEMMPGIFAPFTPKAARDITMVGTEPRFPPSAMMPQKRKDTTTPMIVIKVACHTEMPNPRIHEP